MYEARGFRVVFQWYCQFVLSSQATLSSSSQPAVNTVKRGITHTSHWERFTTFAEMLTAELEYLSLLLGWWYIGVVRHLIGIKGNKCEIVVRMGFTLILYMDDILDIMTLHIFWKPTLTNNIDSLDRVIVIVCYVGLCAVQQIKKNVLKKFQK